MCFPNLLTVEFFFPRSIFVVLTNCPSKYIWEINDCFYWPLLQQYCLLLDQFSCHISVSLYSNIAVLYACCWTSFFSSSCVYNSLGAQAIISPTLNTWLAKSYISLTFWSVVSKTVFFYRKVPKSSIEEAPWWKDEINEHEK